MNNLLKLLKEQQVFFVALVSSTILLHYFAGDKSVEGFLDHLLEILVVACLFSLAEKIIDSITKYNLKKLDK